MSIYPKRKRNRFGVTEIYRANSGNEALDMIADKTINLVVTDE